MIARRVLGEQGEGSQHGPAFWELGECVLPGVFLSSPGSPGCWHSQLCGLEGGTMSF